MKYSLRSGLLHHPTVAEHKLRAGERDATPVPRYLTKRKPQPVLLIVAAPAPERRRGQLQHRLGELYVVVVRQIRGEADRESFRPPEPAEACPLSYETAPPPAAISYPHSS